MYIDRLLDSSLPQNLLQTYANDQHEPPIPEEPAQTIDHGYGSSSLADNVTAESGDPVSGSEGPPTTKKVKRRPSYLYKIADESSPLLGTSNREPGDTATESIHSDDASSLPNETAHDRERIV